MLPPFDEATGYLPAGIHKATWPELVARFGFNAHRLELLSGFRRALDSLRRAGCKRAYLGGSCVSTKPEPNDFDGCWDPTDVDDDLLDPVLLSFANHRAQQKAKFGGEMFPTEMVAAPGLTFLEFFQIDRNDTARGIVEIDLEELP